MGNLLPNARRNWMLTLQLIGRGIDFYRELAVEVKSQGGSAGFRWVAQRL
jgi:hypothetical protein